MASGYLLTALFEGIVIDVDPDTAEALHNAREQAWEVEMMNEPMFEEFDDDFFRHHSPVIRQVSQLVQRVVDADNEQAFAYYQGWPLDAYDVRNFIGTFAQHEHLQFMNSLSELEITVDLETFSSLRNGISLDRRRMSDEVFEDEQYEDYDEETLMPAEDSALYQLWVESQIDRRVFDPMVRNEMREHFNEMWQHVERDEVQRPTIPKEEVRIALEGEDQCCVCLENFPNATFVGCQKSSTICRLCAETVLANGMRCPHCRAEVREYVVGPL